MKKIFILFCLGLIGCATVTKESKTLPQNTAGLEATTKAGSNIETKRVPVDPKEMDNIISVFSEAIKKNPKYAGAYYNRAVAYFYKTDYDKSWQDVHKAESLGFKFNPDFIESLKEVSGREK